MKIKVKAAYISIGLLVCFAVVSYGMNSDDKLVEAIRCRNIPVALNSLNQNVCIDIQDEQGNTLLHLGKFNRFTRVNPGTTKQRCRCK